MSYLNDTHLRRGAEVPVDMTQRDDGRRRRHGSAVPNPHERILGDGGPQTAHRGRIRSRRTFQTRGCEHSVHLDRSPTNHAVLGDEAVGKTSIITRFMYDTFDSAYQVRHPSASVIVSLSSSNAQATVGIDFLAKTMYCDNKPLRFQLWVRIHLASSSLPPPSDPHPHRRHRTRPVRSVSVRITIIVFSLSFDRRHNTGSLVPSYIRECAAAVVVYDITRASHAFRFPVSREQERKTFSGIEKWIDDVRVERGMQTTVFVVGNKSDASDVR
jgi:GTPase SAR1 family protein